VSYVRTQHPNAALTPVGRRKMVALLLEGNWTVAAHTHEELLEIAGWLGDRAGVTREWEIYCMILSAGVNVPINGIYIVINPIFDGARASTGLCLENFEWWSDHER